MTQVAAPTPQGAVAPLNTASLPCSRGILSLIERAILHRFQTMPHKLWEQSPSSCRHYRMASYLVAQTQIGVMVRQEWLMAFARTEGVKGRGGRE